VIASKKDCSLASVEAGEPANFFRDEIAKLSMYNPAAYTCERGALSLKMGRAASRLG
jgi:hypothetical protein